MNVASVVSAVSPVESSIPSLLKLKFDFKKWWIFYFLVTLLVFAIPGIPYIVMGYQDYTFYVATALYAVGCELSCRYFTGRVGNMEWRVINYQLWAFDGVINALVGILVGCFTSYSVGIFPPVAEIVMVAFATRFVIFSWHIIAMKAYFKYQTTTTFCWMCSGAVVFQVGFVYLIGKLQETIPVV